MKEVISIHIGQAGVQIGNAIWELNCAEHGIMPDGTSKDYDLCLDKSFESYFQKMQAGNFVPRSIYVDLEPSVIDEVRSGIYRDLFCSDQLISGLEDASNCFARGFFTVGLTLSDLVSDEINRLCEACERPAGLLIHRSLGGGTGSGFATALLEIFSEYGKFPKIDLPVFPSATLATSTTEPYNCLLAQHFSLEDIDMSCLVDNEAIYNVLTKNFTVNHQSYTNVNRLMAQCYSNLTAGRRYDNILTADIIEAQTNLVPFPRIHFPMISFAPLIDFKRGTHEEITTKMITQSVFSKENELLTTIEENPRFMSCCLCYRGAISPRQIYCAVNKLKIESCLTSTFDNTENNNSNSTHLQFVEWVPTAFKVGIVPQLPTYLQNNFMTPCDKSVSLVANSSAIIDSMKRMLHKFDILYMKRAYVHWFVSDGLEEGELMEAGDNINALITDYIEICTDLQTN